MKKVIICSILVGLWFLFVILPSLKENDPFWGNPDLTARFDKKQIKELKAEADKDIDLILVPMAIETIVAYKPPFTPKDIALFMKEAVPSNYANELSASGFSSHIITMFYKVGMSKEFINNNYSSCSSPYDLLKSYVESYIPSEQAILVNQLSEAKPILSETFYFAPNSVVLKFNKGSLKDLGDISRLEGIVAVATKDPNSIILIESHTDYSHKGLIKPQIAEELSFKRAVNLKSLLNYAGYGLGLKESQIIINSVNWDKPVDITHPELNRRVEIKVYAPIKANG